MFRDVLLTKTAADVIRFLITKPDVGGIVHGTCEDPCTWYDLTVELKCLLNAKAQTSQAPQTPQPFQRELEPCTTDEFPRPAPRPHNSALKKSVLNLLGYRTPADKRLRLSPSSQTFACTRFSATTTPTSCSSIRARPRLRTPLPPASGL